MAKISVVNATYVRNEQRLDSGYYTPEILYAISVINRCRYLLIENIYKELIHPKEFQRQYTKGGILLIRAQNCRPVFLELHEKVYISKQIVQIIGESARVKGKDILLVRSGANFGDVAIVPENLNAYACADVLILRVKENVANPYYVGIYLNTKYGKVLLKRSGIGTAQPHLYTDGVLKIPVPTLSKDFQLHIEQLVKQANEKRKLAEQKYQQAEELLYELLGISKGEIERLDAEKAYETNFKEVKKAFRFDAEYYHPKYSISDKIFKQIPSERLGNKEYFELKKGIEVGSDAYCDENRGVLFLRVSNLSRNGLKLNPSDKYIFKGIYEKLEPKYEPKEGEVLFSKDGTIGTATVVDSDFPPFIISGGVVRIIIKKDFDPYYLAFILNSILSKLQVTREKTGTVIEHLRFSKLKEIKVPKLPLSQQQEIANLVKEYFKLRKEARQLIQRAIREVEEAIENASRSNGE